MIDKYSKNDYNFKTPQKEAKITQLRFTKTFRKDYRKLTPADQSRVEEVIERLLQREQIGGTREIVRVKGKSYSCWNYHIRGDLVLLYVVEPEGVALLRVGPHSNLFR
jgi:mRNA interferase YafQ